MRLLIVMALFIANLVLCPNRLNAQEPSPPLPPQRIALEILEPDERTYPIENFPVQVGLVFTQGELTAENLGGIVDETGVRPLTEQTVTTWWDADMTSVKWLLVKFNASTDKHYFYEWGAGTPPAGELFFADARRLVRSDGVEVLCVAQS